MSISHFIEDVGNIVTMMTYVDIKLNKKNEDHDNREYYYNYEQEIVFNRSSAECYEFIKKISRRMESLMRFDMFDNEFEGLSQEYILEFVGGDKRMAYTIYDHCYMVAEEYSNM